MVAASRQRISFGMTIRLGENGYGFNITGAFQRITLLKGRLQSVAFHSLILRLTVGILNGLTKSLPLMEIKTT
jgi:hypothetical protein